MDPDELVGVSRSGDSAPAATLVQLDWMNGVYLRPQPDAHGGPRRLPGAGDRLAGRADARCAARQEIDDWGSSPILLASVERRDGYALRRSTSTCSPQRGARGLEVFTAEAIERALRDLAERLGQKPRQAFQPIRVAVTGSTVSPGLFESIELLGRDETLARIRNARAAAAGASV
jgi:hypothetical protein